MPCTNIRFSSLYLSQITSSSSGCISGCRTLKYSNPLLNSLNTKFNLPSKSFLHSPTSPSSPPLAQNSSRSASHIPSKAHSPAQSHSDHIVIRYDVRSSMSSCARIAGSTFEPIEQRRRPRQRGGRYGRLFNHDHAFGVIYARTELKNVICNSTSTTAWRTSSVSSRESAEEIQSLTKVDISSEYSQASSKCGKASIAARFNAVGLPSASNLGITGRIYRRVHWEV